MLAGRSGNEKRYLVRLVWSGGTCAVMGLPKSFTGSIITARDSANGVLTYMEIQNSYSEINSIQVVCFSSITANVLEMPV